MDAVLQFRYGIIKVGIHFRALATILLYDLKIAFVIELEFNVNFAKFSGKFDHLHKTLLFPVFDLHLTYINFVLLSLYLSIKSVQLVATVLDQLILIS